MRLSRGFEITASGQRMTTRGAVWDKFPNFKVNKKKNYQSLDWEQCTVTEYLKLVCLALIYFFQIKTEGTKLNQ